MQTLVTHLSLTKIKEFYKALSTQTCFPFLTNTFIICDETRQTIYFSAAIQEIQRCANIVPLNVIHRTTKDTSIGNIPIPNNTYVIGHINHVMARSPVFENPKEFRPERFLMEDGVTPNKIEPAKGYEIDLEPIFAAVLLPKSQPLRLTPLSSHH
ncbi:unnamed protein product [Cylicostephanus goldi]|uniref:Uncharacterized protein n=1 Tax=Cylicostephanus goldi TaxID=71465 RepID=A0A3P7NBK6_CYLGO|nr:unnamed protein product [Cylicostephanus goldi]